MQTLMKKVKGVRFDKGAEEHDPQLYRADGEAEFLTGLDAVDEAAAAHFREQGYLAVHDAFTPDQINAAKAALTDLIRNPDPQNYQLMFEAKAQANYDQLTADDREKAVRKVFTFHGEDPRLDAIAENAAIITALNTLGCKTPQLYQAMALLKGPGGREKPWHQDRAYFNVPEGPPVIGVWIALDEATADNGCMFIMPGKHREPMIHFHRRDWQICDTTIEGIADKRLAVPLPPGGVLFFDSMLPHGTPTNHTPDRRRALQYHYYPQGMEEVGKELRDKLFGNAGKDVEC